MTKNRDLGDRNHVTISPGCPLWNNPPPAIINLYMIVLKISISGREHLLHLTCVTNPAPGEGGRSIVTDSPVETACNGEV